MLGSSPALRQALDLAAVTCMDFGPVFLTGESGTGKDTLARAIHHCSANANGPFVILNAGAIPDDILGREIHGEAGGGKAPPYPSAPRYLQDSSAGTLYLDDVCRMPERAQAQLLEVIRTGRIIAADGTSLGFGARLISATNMNITAALREGRLRRDLYDFLSMQVIELPPLRARNGDAAEIADVLYPQLLTQFRFPEQRLSSAILARIASLPWPGNLHQLQNVLRRMALSSDAAIGRLPSLPADVLADVSPFAESATLPGPCSFNEIERWAILKAIERNGGSIQKAADELILAPSTIYRKLKSWQHAL